MISCRRRVSQLSPRCSTRTKRLTGSFSRPCKGFTSNGADSSSIKRPAMGFAMYQPGSYLYSHTDRLTHIVSSTICVDHRLKSRWPLCIEDLEGRSHEIDVEPGDMVFFEGARLDHGRPYALDGEYYANIFVHYTPTSLTFEPAGGRNRSQS